MTASALVFSGKSLIRTKISPPALPDFLLRRDKLDDLFARIEGASLILVQAPAGYGKSTYLAERLEHTGMPSSWLHLDAMDNDPGHFAWYLAQTLHQQGGRCVQTLAGLVEGGFGDLQACMGCLLAELPLEGQRHFLVLENYQAIHNETIHQAVRFLLRHKPRYLTLVILSRNLPPVGIAQLRMQGRLLEITARDLALGNPEAVAYLEQRLPFELPLEAMERSNRRVEGWFAALQLLASLAETADEFNQQVEALSEGNQFLFDYFEELLGTQISEDQRQFLLRTATLERFNAFLVTRLAAQAEGQSVLGSLLNMGLFIVPLDANGLWYRYHGLFAVYLRHLQRCLMPRQIQTLHQEACDALIDLGLYEEAARHAVAIHDQPRLKKILTDQGRQFFTQGDFPLLQRCLDALERQTINEDPLLTLLTAWVAQGQYRFSEVEAWLDSAEKRLRDHGDPSLWKAIEPEFNTVRAQVAMNFGDSVRALRLALSAADKEAVYLPTSRVAARSVVGEALFVQGNLAQAREHMLQAEQMALAAGAHQNVIWSLCQQSEIAVAQGFLQKAYNLQEKALQYVEAHHLRIPIMEFLYRIRAQIMFEWYHLENAEKFALKGIEIIEFRGEAWLVQHYILLARIAQARGRQSLCGDYIHKIQRAMVAQEYHIDWLTNAHATMLSYWDASNDREAVERWLTEAPPYDTETATNHFLQCNARNWARAYMTLGRLDEAERILTGLMTTGRRHALQTDINRNAINLAQLHWLKEEREASIACMEEAIRLASTTGAVGSFLRIGKVLINILKSLLQTDRLSDMERQRAERLIQLTQQQRDFSKAIRITLDEAIVQDIIDRPDVPELIRTSPLTRREWQVLSLIHAGFSNDQIASHLKVASTTIKTHIRSLYQKQNITHRAEAIALAKDLLGKIQGE